MFSSLVRVVTRKSCRLLTSNNVSSIQCQMYCKSNDLQGTDGKNLESISKTEDIDKIKGEFSDGLLSKNEKIYREILLKWEGRKEKDMRKIFIDGRNPIKEALSIGLRPKVIFYTPGTELKSLNLPEDIEIYCVPEKTLSSSTSQSSKKIVGLFPKPEGDVNVPSKDLLPIQIVCNNIRSPDNLGKILRIADNVRCREVFLTKGSVDMWKRDVLETASGAHFRLRIKKSMTWEEIASNLAQDSMIYLADNNSPFVKRGAESESIGNEIDGDDVGQADTNAVDSSQFLFRKIVEEAKHIPLKPYYSLNYKSNKAIVLVIGGETEGLSLEAYKLAKSRNGVRIYLPMSNLVESLNVSTALGVIAFEIKRQLEMTYGEQQEEPNAQEEGYRGVGLYSE